MSAPKNANKTAKTIGRPFEPGNPGGPGRPAGSRNKATLALDAVADAAAKAVLDKLIETAKEGDLRAADIILARVWPVRKGRPVSLTLPPITVATDIVAALGAVADAVTGGEITPDEGAAVASILEIKRRAIETTDLAARVDAIEKGRT